MPQQPLINCPSLANSNLLELGSDISALYAAGVRYFHIDIMDGHYVPNLCFPVRMISDLKKAYPDAIADVHVMVTDPKQYIEKFAAAGADYVSFHADSTNFVIRTIREIHDAGMKAGVVINPSQRIDIIEPYAEMLDYVVLMSVEPGFAGQKFMTEAVPRVAELSALREKCGNFFLISVDGGINYPNIQPCVRNGANLFVTGIYTVYNQPDGYASACERFEKEMKLGLA